MMKLEVIVFVLLACYTSHSHYATFWAMTSFYEEGRRSRMNRSNWGCRDDVYEHEGAKRRLNWK